VSEDVDGLEGKTCDVCEEQIGAERTATLVYDGHSYEVDLCGDHVRKLNKVLAQFLSVARPGRRLEANEIG
jgi:hypothetical protein